MKKHEDKYSDWISSILKNDKFDYRALSQNKNIALESCRR